MDGSTAAVTGWACATCGTEVDIATPWPWRCPAAGESRHHVLRIRRSLAPMRSVDDPNPIVAFDGELAWAAFAQAHGMDLAARRALVDEVDAAVAAVAGTGFRITPCFRSGRLSDALGFSATGGVFVKDETHNVAGSHKARHLVTIVLHLLAAERLGLTSSAARPPLAIASCGNAAIAAATLAAAMRWPLRVFVPTWADRGVLARLAELGAEVVACPRHAGDPPGDPCVHHFREAVADGAVPFGVQGPENALCLDGGRTLGFEIYEALGHFVDRVFVQVGGGALVTGVGDGLRIAGIHPRIHAVQTEGCAPLERAWRAVTASPGAPWADCMRPWEHEPRSAATGMLDDETYDWLGAVDAMRAGGGGPVVSTESDVLRAEELARTHTSIDADHTGTAGLAGLLTIRDQVHDDERVVVIFSGARRA